MDRTEIAAVWARAVAGVDGPLPGARLDAMPTPHGWCGQVTDAAAADVTAAADLIGTAYDLAAGAVVVHRNGPDSSFVWRTGPPPAPTTTGSGRNRSSTAPSSPT